MAATATTVVEMRSHAPRAVTLMRPPFSLRLDSLWNFHDRGVTGQSVPLDVFNTRLVRPHSQNEDLCGPWTLRSGGVRIVLRLPLPGQ